MQKLRVGVLMGGKSEEREVSFNSGRTVCDHLDVMSYDIIPIFQTVQGALFLLPWSFLHRGKIDDFVHRLSTEAKQIHWHDLKSMIDFMYIAMHGRYAEDGILQGVLEVLGIPYLGSKVCASALGMDKIVQKKMLRAAHIAVPRDIIVLPHEIQDIEKIQQRLNQAAIDFPCIVKPHREGSSLGISVVNANQELHDALQKACLVSKKAQAVLIEEKLDGMEFSCIVITDYIKNVLWPLMPTEIVSQSEVQFYDYKQKYMPGRSLQYTPARCCREAIQKIQEVSVAVMQLLEFENIARIDGFLQDDMRVIITDPNSFSGAAPSSFLFKQAAQAGLNHTHLINHLIKTELHRYALNTEIQMDEMKEKSENRAFVQKRIAVLMGGTSHEKEISLESGRNVVYKLSPHSYEAIPLFVNSNFELHHLDASLLVCNSTQEIEMQLDKARHVAWHELSEIADFVFIALHGGLGENGSVQGMLEMLDIPYNGSGIFASALCMDKYKTARFLSSQGFAVPHSRLLSLHEWRVSKKAVIEELIDFIAVPCIVKPHDDGCSTFVMRPETQDELLRAIDAIFDQGKQYALIEELIVGMELTGGVVGNEQVCALPPSHAISTQGVLSIEEKFLPGAGENQTPAPLSARALQFVQKTLKDVYQVIGCKGYARIDCFYQSANQSPTRRDRVVILEVNTLPGLTPATCIFHQAAEISLKPMEFIDLIIKLGFAEHGLQKESILSLPDPLLLRENEFQLPL